VRGAGFEEAAMRILAASTGGAGHFGPMVPFLRGCVAAGAEVLVAAPGSVHTDEFAFATLPDTPPEILGPIFASLPALPRAEANARVMREVFAGANVDATLAAHEALLAEWRPDVVLREVAEVGSYVAATRAGVPTVRVAIGLSSIEDLLASSVADFFPDRYGVPVERDTPTVSLVPPTLEPGVARERFRDPAMTAANGAAPPLPDGDAPLVYVTFGSVAGALPPFAGVYRAALDALADLPVRVLLTTGAADPESLGPIPPNARVERWVPQAAVLARAAVAVGHGGFGTTFGALAAGVPPVVLPLFSSDQFANAAAVAATGAGLAVESPDDLAAAVTRLLPDAAPERARAGEVAAEMAALPSAADWHPPPRSL
jgi:UDP:flavonoid glycosyltransferase YjiC (YdhE family)